MISAALDAGRAAAEARMLDACTITRASGGPGAYNPVTMRNEPAPTTEVYTGKCEVQSAAPDDPDTPTHGGREAVLTNVTVKVPITVDAQVGDTVTITTSLSDPHLAGSVYTVATVQRKSHATCRRMLCERVD